MDITKAKLPPIYKRNSRDCYLDPIRKRLIYITPEETIRQKMIAYLLQDLSVPSKMIQVEDRLSHYGLKSKDRADIVILGKSKNDLLVPVTVIECKAPTVPLDEKAMNQVLDYSDALGSIYTLLINGNSYFCYKYEQSLNKYLPIEELPSYEGMLEGDFVEVLQEEIPERIPFEKLEKELSAEFAADDHDSYYATISKYTPMNLALPVFNLWEGLLDVRVKMPEGNYGLFQLVQDYGVRMLTYGNESGGQFYGPYRSFLVRIDGSTEFFSIGMSTYYKASWIDKNGKVMEGKHPLTCICVAHDDEKISHHALELLVDEDAVADGNTVRFYHNGRIAIGRIGSGKKSELRALVEERYPEILKDGKYDLGRITSDHLLRLDEPEVINLVKNLISYSIVRDTYREIVKSQKRDHA